MSSLKMMNLRAISGVFLAALCALPVVVSSGVPITPEQRKNWLSGNGAFQYLSYNEVFQFFSVLAEEYPKYIRLHVADEMFPHLREFSGATTEEAAAFQQKMSDMTCGNEPAYIHGRKGPQPMTTGEPLPCESLLVHIADFDALSAAHGSTNKPEVLLIGEVHGNEKVGTSTTAELARQLVQAADKPAARGTDATEQELKWLVQNRNTWIMPLPNAYGYFHNVREDQGVDPNRDSPYLNPNCFQSFTGRFLNELSRTHLFQQMLEFHGGCRQIVFEWAGPNHVMNKDGTAASLPAGVIAQNEAGFDELSSESPDHKAYRNIAEKMRSASGVDGASSEKDFWYPPVGPHTDNIYWIRGGIQDWLYTASWEPQAQGNALPDGKHPIANHCPGYPDAGLDYKHGGANMRSLSFLVETDDNKEPDRATLGSNGELWDNTNGLEGHIPRNLRLSLRVMEMADPAIRFLAPRTSATSVVAPSVVHAAQYKKEKGGEVQMLSTGADSSSNTYLPPSLKSAEGILGGGGGGFYGVGCDTMDKVQLFDICPEDRGKGPLDVTKMLEDVVESQGQNRIQDAVNKQAGSDDNQQQVQGEQLGKHDNLQCTGLNLWERGRGEPSFLATQLTPQAIKVLAERPRCLAAVATFDQHWGDQDHPDPDMRPQSHSVRSRLEASYHAAVGNSVIDTTRTRFFLGDGSSFASVAAFRTYLEHQAHHGTDVASTKSLREATGESEHVAAPRTTTAEIQQKRKTPTLADDTPVVTTAKHHKTADVVAAQDHGVPGTAKPASMTAEERLYIMQLVLGAFSFLVVICGAIIYIIFLRSPQYSSFAESAVLPDTPAANNTAASSRLLDALNRIFSRADAQTTLKEATSPGERARTRTSGYGATQNSNSSNIK